MWTTVAGVEQNRYKTNNGCIKHLPQTDITAYKMIVAKDDLFHQLEVKGAPAKYKQNFNDALAVFSHQTVFDINSGESVPLIKWETPPTNEQQLKCGKCPFIDGKKTPAFQNIVFYKL